MIGIFLFVRLNKATFRICLRFEIFFFFLNHVCGRLISVKDDLVQSSAPYGAIKPY